MATSSNNYSSTTDTTALTITLASLATDANLLTGRESTVVDNTSNKYMDILLSGQITTGTTPTDAKSIEIWAYAPLKIATSTETYPDVLDGTDSAETLSSDDIKIQLARVSTISTDNTSDRNYPVGPVALAPAFGGVIPTHWGIFVTHNTGVNLNATAGNHWIHYLGIKYDTA